MMPWYYNYYRWYIEPYLVYIPYVNKAFFILLFCFFCIVVFSLTREGRMNYQVFKFRLRCMEKRIRILARLMLFMDLCFLFINLIPTLICLFYFFFPFYSADPLTSFSVPYLSFLSDFYVICLSFIYCNLFAPLYIFFKIWATLRLIYIRVLTFVDVQLLFVTDILFFIYIFNLIFPAVEFFYDSIAYAEHMESLAQYGESDPEKRKALVEELRSKYKK